MIISALVYVASLKASTSYFIGRNLAEFSSLVSFTNACCQRDTLLMKIMMMKVLLRNRDAYLNKFLKINTAFAGRSAKRRIR